MNYKQARKAYRTITEAKAPRPVRKPKLTGYSVPTSNTAKFKEGDIVAVHFTNYYGLDLEATFRMYHPQLALPYMNSVGTVRLFQQYSMSSKYGVEFEDGNIIPINSNSLIGPFVSIEAAKKYAGKNGEKELVIDPQDLGGFAPDSNVEKSSVIEDEFKKSFCNSQLGFKWLDAPVIIKYKNYNVYVLAAKKNTVSIEGAADTYPVKCLHFVNDKYASDRLDNPTRPEFDNSFVFIKVIDRQTQKLQKTSAISSSTVSSSYFLQRPVLSKYHLDDSFKDGVLVKPIGIFNVEMLPVGPGLSKTANRIKKEFNVFDNGLIKTGYEHFKLRYNIEEGQTTIRLDGNEMVQMSENILGKHFKDIGKYTVVGGCEVKYKAGATSFQYLPAKVVGDHLFIASEDLHNAVFQSLDGLDKCNVSQVKHINFNVHFRTLNNFPENLNKKGADVYFRRSVDSLVGIPDKLKCDVDFEEIKSYKGADNCEVQGQLTVDKSTKTLSGFFKTIGNDYNFRTLSDKEIKNHLNYRDLVSRVPELDGIF